MSHGLVPSKSTVYVSNLPYGLKNNDLHKLFEKYGKLVKVTIVKDKITRKSKGVAFLLYLNAADATKCVEATNLQEMFGRTLKASIANDNGRTVEFMRRKNYPDKTQCYECGERGHLSYKCEKNLLGERDAPAKKVRKRKAKQGAKKPDGEEDEGEEVDEDFSDDETLSAAIALEQQRKEMEDEFNDNQHLEHSGSSTKRKRIKKSAYFSDEDESD